MANHILPLLCNRCGDTGIGVGPSPEEAAKAATRIGWKLEVVALWDGTPRRRDICPWCMAQGRPFMGIGQTNAGIRNGSGDAESRLWRDQWIKHGVADICDFCDSWIEDGDRCLLIRHSSHVYLYCGPACLAADQSGRVKPQRAEIRRRLVS